MATTQPREQPRDVDKHRQETLNSLIGEQVMHTLGKPTNLLMVQVRPLWDNHYRVNIFVGGDAASATVANSYFLVVGSDGNIKTSQPKLTSQY
jgi:hypothetical protein